MSDFGVAAGTATVRLRGAPGAGALELKLEHLLPSGSVYDRIAGPTLERARALGPGPFLVAGCGSACLSFAAAAARAKVVLELFLPEQTLGEHRRLLGHHRANVREVSGASLLAATRAAESAAATGAGMLVHAAGRPELSRGFWADTLGRELQSEHLGRGRPPPTIFLPSGLADLASALEEHFAVRRVSASRGGCQDGSFAADEYGHEVVVEDEEAFESRRRLATEEGLLLGYSTAAAVHAARSALESGVISTALVVALDAGDRYFSFDGRFRAAAEV